ncbi:MAG: hypothetical protein EOO16_14695 [Chitinophagaceae bacterium]|nr:MAG: hypothetical protein EOO16_14695 [Chitinophagaceae bacterium]
MNKTLLSVFAAFLCGQSFAQPYIKRAAFSKEQSCAYEFLLRRHTIGADKTLPDEYYFLRNDSLLMFQQNLKRGDTISLQVHLVRQADGCGTGAFSVKKLEYIIRDVYRPNPFFTYAPYFKVSDPFSGDYGAAGEPGKMGFLDKAGQWMVPPRYSALKPHSFGIWLKDAEGVRLHRAEDGTESKVYDEISTGAPRIGRDTRLTAVKKNGRMGMIDKTYRELVPPIYDDLKVVAFKFLVGYRNRKMVVISPYTGKEISPLYDGVRLANDLEHLEVMMLENGKPVATIWEPPADDKKKN